LAWIEAREELRCIAKEIIMTVEEVMQYRRALVRHPEIVKLAGGGRIALVEHVPDFEEAIDVLMIVSLQPIDERI